MIEYVRHRLFIQRQMQSVSIIQEKAADLAIQIGVTVFILIQAETIAVFIGFLAKTD